MKITSIRLDRMRLPLDPPFHPAWDPVPPASPPYAPPGRRSATRLPSWPT
jgi:hypothetical protein